MMLGTAQAQNPIGEHRPFYSRFTFLDKDGNLGGFVIIASVMCLMFLAGLCIMQQQERQHPRIIHDIGVCFELMCAPPEAAFRVSKTLMPIRLVEGEKPRALSNQKTNIDQSGKVVTTAARLDQTNPKTAALRNADVQASTPVPAPPVAMATSESESSGQGSTSNNAPKSDAQSPSMAGGSLDQKQDLKGHGGTGAGAGKGDINALEGGDFGANDRLSMAAPALAAPTAAGNIRPYTNDLIARINQNWHPDRDFGNIVLAVVIDRNGHLLESQIVQGCNNRKYERSLLQAVEATEFAPLPAWFAGNKIRFHVNLTGS